MAAPKGNKFSPGRKPDYDTKFDRQAKRLALLGCTNKELAEFFGVVERTINRWLKDHESFCQAVKAGRMGADAKVANSLFKRATGYTYPSEKIFQSEGVIIRAPFKAVVLPDPGAAMNWLKNRQPDKWADSKKIDLSGELDLTMHLDDSPKEEETEG